MAERRFTDLELERSLAGDLPAARASELEAKATDADRARLAELAAEHASFLGSVDVDVEVRRIEQRMAREAPRRPVWIRWLAPVGALAAAAVVLIVIVTRGPRHTEQAPGEDDLQVKGGEVTLVIHAAAGDHTERLASGDTVAPGARLRFEVDGTQRGYVAVIGIDGTGHTTVYYPYGGTQAVPLGLDRLLPGAIQLDAIPGDERFIALFSTKPFAIPQQPGAPAGVMSSEVVLHKK